MAIAKTSPTFTCPRVFKSVVALFCIATFFGCGGGGGGAGTSTTLLQGDPAFRASALAGYQSLGAGDAYPFPALQYSSPTGSITHSRAAALLLSRFGSFSHVRSISAVTRIAPLTFVSTLNLYTDGGVISGNIATLSYFSDSAGTKPAGNIVITLPTGVTDPTDATSYAGYPAVVNVAVNITAGSLPCKGAAVITFSGKSGANSMTGTMTLTKNNVEFDLNLGLSDALDVTGTITIRESGATISATNIQGKVANTLTCNVSEAPYGWTGSGTINLTTGAYTVNLKTGTGTSTAASDTSGNLTIKHADGTTETVNNALTTDLSGKNGTGTGTGAGTPTYNTPISLGALTPLQINNTGQILAAQTDTNQTAVILSNSTATPVPLPGVTGGMSTAFSHLAMNNNGKITGNVGTSAGSYWSSATAQPVVLPGNGPTTSAISDSGVIVGSVYNSFSGAATAWPTPTTSVPMNQLGVYDNPLAISAGGKVVGWVYNSNSIGYEFWPTYSSNAQALTRPSTLTGNPTPVAMGVNDSSQICAALQNGGAVYWSSPTATGQFLPGFDTSLANSDAANAINAGGQIVGHCFSSGFFPHNFHAVVWKSLKVQDLNTAIPSGGSWVLTNAVSINDFGVIVGSGYHTVNGTEKLEAFVLTPK